MSPCVATDRFRAVSSAPPATGYRTAFGTDGYLVRARVLDAAECDRLRAAVEAVS